MRGAAAREPGRAVEPRGMPETMRLVETIAAFMGRVELVLAGAEGALRDGTDALARGDAMRARKEARVILSRLLWKTTIISAHCFRRFSKNPKWRY